MRLAIIRTMQTLILIGLLGTNVVLAAGHEACSDCHKNAEPTEGNSDLTHPVETLCIECHKSGTRDSDHAMGVPPGPDGAGTLPLVDGKIGCITCHDSHSKSVLLLRFTTDELCLSCHLNH